MSDAWQYITPETKKFRKNKDGETTAIRAKWYAQQFGGRILRGSFPDEISIIYRFNDQVNQQKVNKTGFGGSSRWYA